MNEYPRQKWSEHLRTLAFRQGEHIAVFGPTSSGKTTLIREIIERRGHVVCLMTKLKDPTIQKDYQGFKRFDRWPKHGFKPTEDRVMIWPYPEKTLPRTKAKQKAVMSDAFNHIARDGGWCVMLDETLYMTDARMLNLQSEVSMLHYYGRSAGISAVTLSQRPYHVPRVVLSSSTHAYFAKTYDAGDRKRLTELGGVNPREITFNMDRSDLSRHDFIYVNPQGDASPRIVNTRK